MFFFKSIYLYIMKLHHNHTLTEIGKEVVKISIFNLLFIPYVKDRRCFIVVFNRYGGSFNGCERVIWLDKRNETPVIVNEEVCFEEIVKDTVFCSNGCNSSFSFETSIISSFIEERSFISKIESFSFNGFWTWNETASFWWTWI